jgi:hypothetical protein
MRGRGASHGRPHSPVADGQAKGFRRDDGSQLGPARRGCDHRHCEDGGNGDFKAGMDEVDGRAIPQSHRGTRD